MKRLFTVCMIILLFLTGCNPVPQEDIPEIDLEVSATAGIGEERINAILPYVDSEITVDAEVKRFERDELYTYKLDGALVPSGDAILKVFPQLKDEAIELGGEEGEIRYVNGETLVSVSEGFSKIILRQRFASEDKINDEYGQDEVFEFPISYEQAESSVLEGARTLFSGDGIGYAIKDVRRFGKHTGENYYYFNVSITYDNVAFTSYGRSVEIGKDDEGYAEYVRLKGGSYVTFYLDASGISEASWNTSRLVKNERAELLDIETVLSKFAAQAKLYSMNNYAEYLTDGNNAYIKGSVVPYVISKIEQIYAVDFISQDSLDKSKVQYVPCWKISAYTQNGQERYTIVNGISGEVMATRF